MDKYESLRPYCNTDAQRHLLDVLATHSTVKDVAQAMNLARRSVFRRIQTLKKQAARRGFSLEHDMSKTVPEGYSVKGVSTLYDDNGEVKVQWVKSQQDVEQQKALMEEAIAALHETIKPTKKVAAPKKKADSELLNLHILTDYHMGMMSWPEETGEEWDIKIAEQLLMDWFEYTIKNAPPAEVGILAQLGDFLHWDGSPLGAVTPVSGHILDADTRFQKVVRVAIRSLRRIIGMMLKKYQKLHLVMADANHDPASGAWLREMFAAFYEDESRITVDNSADTYYVYEHGETSLFFHHGHKRKPDNVHDVFAAKFRDIFGRTKHSYAHMGHMHHQFTKETNLMIVNQWPTMAAADAYASRLGFGAIRSAPVISYSKAYGEVGRLTATPDMVSK